MILYIFHRDLRVRDNTAFNYALRSGKKIIPMFVFDDNQVKNNKYKSIKSILFMIDCIKNLNIELGGKLKIYRGDLIKIIKQLLIIWADVDEIVFNQDYTKFAKNRTRLIKKNTNCKITIFEDYILFPMGSILTEKGKPYKVFTPFYNKAIHTVVPKPKYIKLKNILRRPKPPNCKYPHYRHHTIPEGSRKRALEVISRSKNKENNTRLGPFIKFGCVSVREVWYKLPALRRSLIWRDFYYSLEHFYGLMHKKSYNGRVIKWIYNPRYLEAWKEGKTGFPIIDAGMRELRHTGYIDNRMRLIVSNFLTRMLLLDWRYGEEYFATQLIDYDPILNNGNWQWSASTGADRAPPQQRIFNPSLQSYKYDRDASYIKKWVPELRNMEAANIHNWSENNNYNNYYIKPVVNYNIQKLINIIN
jgi:deoxyribodipyrimidine photo-lyase